MKWRKRGGEIGKERGEKEKRVEGEEKRKGERGKERERDVNREGGGSSKKGRVKGRAIGKERG